MSTVKHMLWYRASYSTKICVYHRRALSSFTKSNDIKPIYSQFSFSLRLLHIRVDSFRILRDTFVYRK
jgi:hypothetical protein